jgi:hypothetical protein
MKVKQLLGLSLITIALMTGCKKYDDGPSFSLLSRKSRLANTWTPESCTYDGTDCTSGLLSGSWQQVFEKDGDYRFSFDGYSESGKWEFVSDDEQVRVTVGSDITTITLLRLTSKELWYTINDGALGELHLKGK